MNKACWLLLLATCVAFAQLSRRELRDLERDRRHKLDQVSLLDEPRDVWFESIPPSELEELWSEDEEEDGKTLAEKIARLRRFEATVFIDVRLVGFEGDGRLALSVEPSDLQRYLDADHDPTSTAYILHTEPGQSHELPFRVRYVYRVSRAPKTLHTQVAQAVAKAASQSGSTRVRNRATGREEVLVPVSAVDDVLKADYTATGLTYTVYVLNTEHDTPYVYDQQQQQQQRKDGGKAAPECRVVHWVGTDRYVWFDLSAGPVTFGPHTAGDGIFTEYTLPRPEQLFTGKAAGKESPEYKARFHQMLAELAANVRTTAELLINPSMQFYPIPFTMKLVVNLIFIYDRDSKPDESRET